MIYLSWYAISNLRFVITVLGAFCALKSFDINLMCDAMSLLY